MRVAVVVWLAFGALGCEPATYYFGPELGDPCRASDDCDSGFCLNLGNEAGVGVCSRTCPSPGCGSSQYACISGFCVPARTERAELLAPCGAVGPASFGACETGLECVAWPDWLPSCARRCFANTECDDNPCLDTGAGFGVCALHP